MDSRSSGGEDAETGGQVGTHPRADRLKQAWLGLAWVPGWWGRGSSPRVWTGWGLQPPKGTATLQAMVDSGFSSHPPRMGTEGLPVETFEH